MSQHVPRVLACGDCPHDGRVPGGGRRHAQVWTAPLQDAAHCQAFRARLAGQNLRTEGLVRLTSMKIEHLSD